MKLLIGDSHLHTKESDGAYSVAQVADFAIQRGLAYICFTDHYPRPDEVASNGKDSLSDTYINEIAQAKEHFKGVIDIALGSEFDWLEPHTDWTAKEIQRRNYDYILGSIHFLTDSAGKLWPIDENEEKFGQTVRAFGGIEQAVCEYYRQLRLMIQSGLFDGLGHFDLIRIYNKSQCLFSEDSDWYKRQVLQTLDVLAQSRMCMEINTNGWYKKCGVQYPTFWILQEAKKRNIPITLSSDGHRDDSIGRDLTKAWQLAQQAGYDSIVRFKNREMIVIKPL